MFHDMAMICDALNIESQKSTNGFFFNFSEKPLGHKDINEKKYK